MHRLTLENDGQNFANRLLGWRALREKLMISILGHWIGLFGSIIVISAIFNLFIPRYDILIFAALSSFALYPKLREKVLFVATFLMLPEHLSLKPRTLILEAAPFLKESYWVSHISLAALGLMAVLCFTFTATRIKKLKKQNAFRRNGFFSILFLLVIVLAVIDQTNKRGTLYAVVSAIYCFIAIYLWYFAYDFQIDHERHSETGRWEFFKKFAYYRPFWCFYFIAPIPRGESTIKAVEATNSDALRVSQSKGVILVIWAGVLLIVSKWVGAFLFAEPFFGVRLAQGATLPNVTRALEAISHHQRFSILGTWQIIFGEFFQHLAFIAAWGHLIVGVARFSGYQSLRNTYRPLSSTTFVEFFNRYNYFYKELLVQIFYYPAFFGWAKRFFPRSLRARVGFSVFFSTGFANFVIHIFLHIEDYLRAPFLSALHKNAQYALYCFCLSVAVTLSQLNQLRAHPFKIQLFRTRIYSESGPAATAESRWQIAFNRLISIAIVLTFFATLRIFDDGFNGNIRNNLNFVLGTVGVHL